MASERPPSSRLGRHLLAAGRQDDNGVTGHESSAIFSLEMLVSDRRHEERGDAPSDDSGLIDLAALSAGAGLPAAPSPTMARPGAMLAGGLFPEAPAPAAPPAALAPVPRGGNRRLVLALSAAVTVLFCALVFQVVRIQGAASRAAPAPSTPPTALATAEPGPPEDGAATAPSSAPPAPPAASAPAQASSAPTSPRPFAARPPKPAAPPPVASPPAKSARPVGKACPCPPEDLICQMRCATSR